MTYNSLRLWLSGSGSLDQEDEALYQMRNFAEGRRSYRFLFGTVFGWGVRITNIALSAVMCTLGFMLCYKMLDGELRWVEAWVLSVQSFASGFFGGWKQYAPGGLLVGMVTAEALLGIIFVTVFVGAYIRKLLR